MGHLDAGQFLLQPVRAAEGGGHVCADLDQFQVLSTGGVGAEGIVHNLQTEQPPPDIRQR